MLNKIHLSVYLSVAVFCLCLCLCLSLSLSLSVNGILINMKGSCGRVYFSFLASRRMRSRIFVLSNNICLGLHGQEHHRRGQHWHRGLWPGTAHGDRGAQALRHRSKGSSGVYIFYKNNLLSWGGCKHTCIVPYADCHSHSHFPSPIPKFKCL